MFQPKTLIETIMPLVVANFIFGLGIWSGKTNLRTIISIVYSITCIITFVVLAKISMAYMEIYYLNKANSFGNLIYQAIFYTNICLTFCLIISGLGRIKVMRVAFARIIVCEKAMEQIGISKNYRNFYLYQLYALGLVILLFIAFFAINFEIMFQVVDTPPLIKAMFLISSHYPVGLLYVADVSFLHWVRYSRIRFNQLNTLLQGMLTTTPDSPQHKRVLKMKDEWNKTFISSTMQQNNGTKDNADIMRAVKQIHLELIKCIRITNEAYGIQTLLSMTVSFVFITSLLYNAYAITWIDISTEIYRQEMISNICWVLFYASKVFIINHMCALATIEAANTGDIICELYEPSTSKEFRAEIRDFTLQLIQNPLIFTACGFFNLDHTFIHGVIGSITTYLVILIQVGDMPAKTANTTLLNNETDLFTTSISV